VSAEQGLAVFIGAIKYNFYPLLMLAFTLLVCAGVIPDFGPMRKAEIRAAASGQLVRPGAKPLVGDADEAVAAQVSRGNASILLELLIPVLLLIGVGTWTLISSGAVKIVEAFMLANSWLFLILAIRGRLDSVVDIADIIVAGTKGVMAALLIVALAYALNSVTTQLGAGQFMIEQFTSSLNVNYLIVITFCMTAAISFSTGTSWGAYAMMMPVALPVAIEFSDGAVGPLVYQTVAAIAGGGIFGDHASPVSDTTVLSSVGAGSDHIDHVITQLPYALLVAVLTALIYLWI
jgi:Na+/H+ antiporter NhaC